MKLRVVTRKWLTGCSVAACLLVPVVAQVRALAADAAKSAALASPPASQWAHVGPDGKLAYRTLPTGDRIMDFSWAGYMGAGVAIPTVPVRVTVGPSGADDTAAIQAALDAASRLEPVNGMRGAVLLKRGAYECRSALYLRTSGVVLRGSGSGANGTALRMTGTPHVCISLSGSWHVDRTGRAVPIVDTYVPSGANSFRLSDASGFSPGDAVLVNRPITPAWVHFMRMDGLVRGGRKETWLSESGWIESERTIKAITGDGITVDVPLSDSFNAVYLDPPGASLVKCLGSGRISQVGVEQLRIVAPPQAVEIRERHHQGIRMYGVCDGWLRDIAIEDTVNSVGIGSGCCRVTVEAVSVRHSVATKGAAKPADFSAGGSQILFNRCEATGNNLFYFVTGARVTGPNVLLNCTFHGNGHIQPHQRWATGLLVDGCQVPDSGIDFMNRGEMGSGHGWTIGWAVAWNCVARSYVIQQPPGAMNWAIGCLGARAQSGMPFGHEPKLPEGTFDSHGTPVAPASLYLAQLRDRLGPEAVKNIGY
ncbi:MAG TPA: hypothetical protein VMU04_17175 [Candidatus Acidoferrum sp.]|nr:hypothetical protein [Candidatus Acidoferrum sp.]